MFISREKIDDFEWSNNPHVFYVFFKLLFKASYKDKRWEGVDIKRGQLVTGRAALSKELNLSEQVVRTCLDKLTKSGYINQQSTNRYTIITICNYDSWQTLEKTNNQQLTSEPTNNQPTDNHNINKENKDNIKEENILNPYNPLTGDGEILLSRLTELSEENRRLQEENEELKKKKTKKKSREDYDVRADLSYVDERYFDKWNEWLSYKDKIGKQYKTQEGAVKQYHQWLNTSGGSFPKACAIIDQSIQWSWTGLFDVKDWVEPEEKKDPWIPNLEKYEPAELEYNKRFDAFEIPNKCPEADADWPYNPNNRPNGAKVCNGSTVWRWDAAYKAWIILSWEEIKEIIERQ